MTDTHNFISLFENPLNDQDVELIIKRALGSETKVIEYRVEGSSGKMGFMGAHRHLVVYFQKKNNDNTGKINFFLKSVPYNVCDQVTFIEENRTFYKETNFYSKIMRELTFGLKDKSWAAQCFLIKDDALVFEDLKDRNFGLKEKILDEPCVKAALKSLAKMHAASILAEKRMGKTFLELYPDLLQEVIWSKDGSFKEYLRTGIDVTIAVAKKLGLNSDCVPKICEQVFDLVKPSKTRRNVICHGDAWSYNMMFDDSKPQPKCVLVDYQFIHYVPGTCDVTQMLYVSTKRQFREENEENLLRYYHSVLCEGLAENNAEIELPTFEDIWQEYVEVRLLGMITASFYNPVIQVDNKIIAQKIQDNEGYKEHLLKDRADVVLKLMDTDPYYNDRVTELVTEMVEKSKFYIK